MLKPFYISGVLEAGTDEAGRGCLAGPVFAAAVILPPDFKNDLLNDSKQLTENERYRLRPIIEKEAIAWAVASASAEEIDEHNILYCSILAMHRALEKLKIQPEHIIVDGNRFRPYISAETGMAVPSQTIVKGDAKYLSIAAASVLAKTYRDDFMLLFANKYPEYGWKKNKGYPTVQHRRAVLKYGHTPLHRKTFTFRTDDL